MLLWIVCGFCCWLCLLCLLVFLAVDVAVDVAVDFAKMTVDVAVDVAVDCVVDVAVDFATEHLSDTFIKKRMCNVHFAIYISKIAILISKFTDLFTDRRRGCRSRSKNNIFFLCPDFSIPHTEW